MQTQGVDKLTIKTPERRQWHRYQRYQNTGVSVGLIPSVSLDEITHYHYVFASYLKAKKSFKLHSEGLVGSINSFYHKSVISSSEKSLWSPRRTFWVESISLLVLLTIEIYDLTICLSRALCWLRLLLFWR